jgi:hypothetical protein
METIKEETVYDEKEVIKEENKAKSLKEQPRLKMNRAQRRRIMFSKPTKDLIFNQIITMRSLIQKDFKKCVKYFKFVNQSDLTKYTKNDLRRIKNKYMKFLRFTEDLTNSENKYPKKDLESMALNYAKELHN